jgi:hypothetical protein
LPTALQRSPSTSLLALKVILSTSHCFTDVNMLNFVDLVYGSSVLGLSQFLSLTQIM